MEEMEARTRGRAGVGAGAGAGAGCQGAHMRSAASTGGDAGTRSGMPDGARTASPCARASGASSGAYAARPRPSVCWLPRRPDSWQSRTRAGRGWAGQRELTAAAATSASLRLMRCRHRRSCGLRLRPRARTGGPPAMEARPHHRARTTAAHRHGFSVKCHSGASSAPYAWRSVRPHQH